MRPSDVSGWERLQDEADRPEVQEEIRRRIREGLIRIRPGPDGRIRIIPAGPTPAEPGTPAIPASGEGAVAARRTALTARGRRPASPQPV
jgi:hypothetical protein